MRVIVQAQLKPIWSLLAIDCRNLEGVYPRWLRRNYIEDRSRIGCSLNQKNAEKVQPIYRGGISFRER